LNRRRVFIGVAAEAEKAVGDRGGQAATVAATAAAVRQDIDEDPGDQRRQYKKRNQRKRAQSPRFGRLGRVRARRGHGGFSEREVLLAHSPSPAAVVESDLGWTEGFEPSISRATTWRLNR